MYELISASNMTVRPGHTTFEFFTPNKQVPRNTRMAAPATYHDAQGVEHDSLWIAPADGNQVKAGDQWLRITEPEVGWVAVVHLGTRYCTLTERDVEYEPSPVKRIISVVVAYETLDGQFLTQELK